MSLNWDLTKCDHHEEIQQEGLPWTITTALIYSSIPVMFGEITLSNHEEFYLRLKMYEKISGSMVTNYEITLKDIRRRIGLHTNVLTESKSKFLKNLNRIHEENTRADLRRELHKMNNEADTQQVNHH